MGDSHDHGPYHGMWLQSATSHVKGRGRGTAASAMSPMGWDSSGAECRSRSRGNASRSDPALYRRRTSLQLRSQSLAALAAACDEQRATSIRSACNR